MSKPLLPMPVSEFADLLRQSGVDLDEATIRRHIDDGFVPIDGDSIDLIAYLCWLLNGSNSPTPSPPTR